MVHSSGIIVNDVLRSKLIAAFQEPTTAYVKVVIEGDSFVCEEQNSRESLLAHAPNNNPTDANVFLGLKHVLTSPCYIFFRPFQNTSKWIFLFFIPLVSSIRDRMIYSSSCAILKDTFTPTISGGLSTWNVSEVNECTIENYFQSIETLSADNMMTMDERIANESELAAHLSMGTQKVRAVIDLPIQISPAVTEKLVQFATQTKVNTQKANEKDASANEVMTGEIYSIIFSMESNEEKLTVDNVFENRRWEDVSAHLPLNEPRYILSSLQVPTASVSSLSLNSPSVTDSSSPYSSVIIFHYYCPDAIKPKLKMFYSTCKNMAIKFCEANEVVIQKSFEISERNEFSVQTVLSDLNANYTTMNAPKKTFTKPSVGRGGSKAGKKFLGAAFAASP